MARAEPTISTLLSNWRSDPSIAPNISDWEVIPARQPRLTPIPPGVHPDLSHYLRSNGIPSLYSHQVQCWEAAQAGKNVVVATGTASGKTLCYNLPVVDHLIRQPEARALYLFPTKALSQDQKENLFSISAGLPNRLEVAIYDGDTPVNQRREIREKARLLISNPDMLHTGILPHHTAWADFFRNLRFIVIDEIHTYRGVFGSHLANLLRRLQRIARFYGSFPQFMLTSATIGNPVELAGWLIEEEVTLIDDDGSAHGPRNFILYNPPIVNPELGIRRGLLIETTRLAHETLKTSAQTLIFGRTRRSVELLLNYLRLDQPELAQSVRGYRSGYLPLERREIEQGLRRGEVRAVAATTALELGIDIGGMGAVLLAGYPGTIAATRQQAGRAGRRAETSLAVLVTSADPLDQFLAHHPEYLFGRSPEHALINPNNPLILLQHIRCAAFELPFQPRESFGRLPAEQVEEYLSFLQQNGELHSSNGKYFWMADAYPAQDISLRSASPDAVVLLLDGEESSQAIGQVDYASALWMVHPQAIYLHEGQMYQVKELDLNQNVAHLQVATVDYYTEPRSETQIKLVELLKTGEGLSCHKFFGEVQVTTQVIGFRKIRWYTNEHLDLEALDLPPTDLLTTGYWLSLTEQAVEQLRQQNLWSNDPNNYGPNWNEQKEKARARDGYCCQSCYALESGKAHHVHHKIPFRTFVSYEQANQLDNLVTLCPNCHRQVESAVRIRSGLSGLAYVLGQLAPLFLMCDYRDLGIHSDPQSPLADGKPTVILYDEAPAGIGLSDRLFEIQDVLIQRAYEQVTTCACTEGCPSCIGPAGEKAVGGKKYSLAILAALNGKPFSPAGETVA